MCAAKRSVIRCGQLEAFVDKTVKTSAKRAAADFADAVRRTLQARPEANVIFAGAESQMEFHRALARLHDVDWAHINAFAVDDFWSPGLPPDLAVAAEPRRELYAKVKPKSINVLDPSAPDAEAEARRYEALIRARPPDIACIGIGCSGHLALNEPGDTNFAEPRWVRVVDVCQESQRQLEQDPNFKALGTIPARGITLTIPAILHAEAVLVIVPYAIKAPIIRRFMDSPVTEALPASILKDKAGTRLYLDEESSFEMGM